MLVEAEIVSGVLAISDESEAMAFFRPSGFPPESEIIPPARRILRDIAAGAVGVLA